MWELARDWLGDVSPNELALVAVIFAAVLLYSWAPRIGAAVGGLFEGGDEPPS